jgi:hypothetical protein
MPVTLTSKPCDRVRVVFVAGLLAASFAPAASAQVIVGLPPYPYRYAGAIDSSVRVEVAPKSAQVFVDGYYAGIVDDFDGAFQRLHAVPGQHDITLVADGFRTVHQNVYLMPDKTLHIKLKMEPLGPGEVADPPPMPSERPAPPAAPFPGPVRGRGPGPGPFPPTEPPPPEAPPREAPRDSTGTLTLEVQPADADVLVDGQAVPLQGQGSAMLDLPEGRHAVQVRKSGYVGYLTEVDIRRGASTPLTIALRLAQ